jgi:hypothetical protein
MTQSRADTEIFLQPPTSRHPTEAKDETACTVRPPAPVGLIVEPNHDLSPISVGASHVLHNRYCKIRLWECTETYTEELGLAEKDTSWY